MIKEMTCIECPVGCSLAVEYEGCKVTKVSGNKCPKAEPYAAAEIENPERFLTSVVLCEGLGLKMLSVRTDEPIPKKKISDAMAEIKKIRLRIPVQAGDIIAANFLGLGVNLIATREAEKPRSTTP